MEKENINLDFQDPGVMTQTMKRLVLTLHMCDEIEEERIARRKVILTLKKAG